MCKRPLVVIGTESENGKGYRDWRRAVAVGVFDWRDSRPAAAH